MRSSSKQIFSVKTITMCAVMAAVTAVSAQISIPMPSGVSITLQTFAVALTGYLLGIKPALASIAVYILLGAIGAPVFTGFKGGAAVLTGVTGGFIAGFLPMTAMCGIRINSGKESINRAAEIVLGLIGLALCHVFGTLWFSLMTHTSPAAAFVRVSLPYLLKDIVSTAAAWIIAQAVKRAVKI